MSTSLWQPKLRSQTTPPAEILYHYVRLFSSQGKIIPAWHALKWFHTAHTAASKSDNVETLKQCIEKGWLFATSGPAPTSLEGSKSIVVAAVLPSVEGFTPSLDLLYNYIDQISQLGLTQTCWYLFEWLQMAFSHACKRDMNPYSTGPTANALKLALSTQNLVASPRDIPYMQDYLRVRSAVGFEESTVDELVSDKLWDRLPGRFQMEILEIGRKPVTARDRYGCHITPEVLGCTHGKRSPSYTHLLAAGGCDCAHREDVSWADLPELEFAMVEDFAEDNVAEVEYPRKDLSDDNLSELSDDEDVFDSESEHDSDSAYESDDEEDKDVDPLAPASPRIRIVDGSQSPTGVDSDQAQTFEKIQKVFVTLEAQRIQKMREWVFNTQPIVKKRSRSADDEKEVEERTVEVKRRRS